MEGDVLKENQSLRKKNSLNQKEEMFSEIKELKSRHEAPLLYVPDMQVEIIFTYKYL